ncbi:phospho-N-acetylmuramoyl-pentapeptide-transferase [Lactonifactor longoviformis]|uniref:phospho-N-acetylmuramoyl-pentapeptide- transferase n=1 Tax=Lactonifactor longoviformis TaxID=341220 RepID=UPI0021091400|nr:phospho-N-acetylmuramoyl-pentapeptide-transferase [Lactonifactor longoviformis]MCQ4672878.1 phospho-N-acetylmuramoyl-pentapeptide-transferase [Lactonifactor longoviformis]
MVNFIINGSVPTVMFLGILFAFFATCFCTAKFHPLLPKDIGRDFAHDGKLSAGKPRGAGFIFILVFAASGLIFARLSGELVIYIILVVAAMMMGFLDDASKVPWGEYKKGFLDFVIAAMVAVTFLNYNSNKVEIMLTGTTITIPAILFGILTVILVWASINVTNCSDGVDGLSGTLTLVTIISIYIIDIIKGKNDDFSYLILLFAVCILGYLWFNATPSKLMMGDAGSRAMGLFISIAVLKTGSPFLYLLVALVLILDGGLGLLKVSLLRFLKIRILKNVRTPLHDHVRKVWGWSNTQTVFRFTIIQIVISMAAVYLVIMRMI